MPLTEPPVRRYFRKLRRFSPSTEQTTFFAHRYGIFTAVRSLKPTLTKNLLSAVFLIASVPHCRRFWQVFCACFCAFCRATTKGGGKLTTFFQKPSLPMLQMQFAPLPTSHTAIVQNFFHYFPHLSANGTATVAGRKCRVLFVKNFVENVNVKFVVVNFNYRVQTVLQFHSQRKAVSLLHEAVIFQKRTVCRTSVQHVTVIHGKIVPLFL